MKKEIKNWIFAAVIVTLIVAAVSLHAIIGTYIGQNINKYIGAAYIFFPFFIMIIAVIAYILNEIDE